MIKKPMDVLTAFPVRKSKKQKQAFRDEIQSYAQDLGYVSRVEKGSFGSYNVVIGNPEKAKYLITAHYDTCAWLPFPNLITPCNFVTFLLYQLLLVVLIFAVAVVVGVGVGMLLESAETAGLIAYGVVLLFLILMMVGPANKHNANDNTSGVVTVLEIVCSMPENLRDQVCFVLFDLEEAGLIGSSSYRRKHRKALQNQIVLNLDCVGDGDEILFFPTSRIRRNPERMAWLSRYCGSYGTKSINVRKKGFSYYPSDQVQFPLGVGICALRRNKMVGLYLGRIHTSRDTILDESNINVLRACLISLIGCGTAE